MDMPVWSWLALVNTLTGGEGGAFSAARWTGMSGDCP